MIYTKEIPFTNDANHMELAYYYMFKFFSHRMFTVIKHDPLPHVILYQALTKFLKSVNWTVTQEAKQALDMLPKWIPMDVEDALELLGPTFSHPSVRKYAVTRLSQADDQVGFC